MPRGCGSRIAGGAYLSVPLGAGPTGHPIEEFLYCQPQAIDLAVLGMSAVGVTLIKDGQGVTHVLDVVGSEHYPNVAAFVEEARRKGISRRFPAREQYFERLTDQSRLVLAHARAIICNPEDYYQWESEDAAGRHECPTWVGPRHCGRGTKLSHHCYNSDSPEFCARLWWQDCTGPCGVPVTASGQEDDSTDLRLFTVGDIGYFALPRLAVLQPIYQTAFFASFPIKMIEVIRDPLEGKHLETLERAAKARLPIHVEDE
jgi:hypothetical protein